MLFPLFQVLRCHLRIRRVTIFPCVMHCRELVPLCVFLAFFISNSHDHLMEDINLYWGGGASFSETSFRGLAFASSFLLLMEYFVTVKMSSDAQGYAFSCAAHLHHGEHSVVIGSSFAIKVTLSSLRFALVSTTKFILQTIAEMLD